MVSHWSLSNSKSPQVSRTLLGILADFNNAVVWMVSTRLLIFKFSSPFINSLVTAPSAPITSGITVTFMFHSFSNPLARFRYLSFFLLSLNFTQPEQQSSQYGKFSFLLLIIIKSGRLAEIR